jgi:hypothetical protein
MEFCYDCIRDKKVVGVLCVFVRAKSRSIGDLDEINLNLMLAIMSEDPNLTPHEINLRQTLVSIIETHGRTGKKRRERLL